MVLNLLEYPVVNLNIHFRKKITIQQKLLSLKRKAKESPFVKQEGTETEKKSHREQQK